VRITTLVPALAVALLAVACNESPTGTAAAEPLFAMGGSPEWLEFTLDVAWTAYNECVQEDLHGSGQAFVRQHTVTTAGETRNTFHVSVVEGTWQLEGMSSGDIWLPLPGVHSLSMRTSSGTFAAVTERFVFENQTTGQVLDWPSKIHFVTNANGEVKVDRVEVDACTLRH